MKEQKIFDAITYLPDNVIAEASMKKKTHRWLISAVAAVLVLALVFGSVLWQCSLAGQRQSGFGGKRRIFGIISPKSTGAHRKSLGSL